MDEDDENNSKFNNLWYLYNLNLLSKHFGATNRSNYEIKEIYSVKNFHHPPKTPEEIMKRINPLNSRILVVDDQPFNVLAIKLLLKSFDWITIDSAYDGK